MVTAAVQFQMKSSIIWNLPGLFCAYCYLNLNHHYQRFHIIQVPCEQILAHIIFIFHIFHVFIFHLYRLALKALRTRSYMAFQARKISGRDSFSYKELRESFCSFQDFSNPLQKTRGRSFVLLMVDSVPHVASQVAAFALSGAQHIASAVKNGLSSCSILKLCSRAKRGTLGAALVAEKTWP